MSSINYARLYLISDISFGRDGAALHHLDRSIQNADIEHILMIELPIILPYAVEFLDVFLLRAEMRFPVAVVVAHNAADSSPGGNVIW